MGRTSDVSSLEGLKICLIGINFAPDSTGIAPYNTSIAVALRDAGAEVHVVAGVPHYPEWRIKDSRYLKGSRWHELFDDIKVTRVKHTIPSTSNLMSRGSMEASFLARAAPEVHRDKSDVVIAVTPSLAGLAAGVLGKRGRPLGAVVQDLTGNAAGESGTTGGRASRTIAAFEYSLLRQAQLVGVITPQFASILTGQRVASERLQLIPNFSHIRPADESRSQARSKLGWPDRGVLVVHTGNMGMKQGLDSVVEAARISSEEELGILFLLVGDGNQRRELELLASQLKTVVFVDPLSSGDYPSSLAASDILLLNEKPGVKEMSLPSKLTSYTGATRPIVAAVEHGGITHDVLTEHAAARIVAPGKPRDLVEAILEMSADASVSERFATSAKKMHDALYQSGPAHKRYVAFAERLAGIAK